MDDILQYLISKGIITQERFDSLVEQERKRMPEPDVIRDIGRGLLLSLQNDDDIGQMLVQILMKQDELEARVAVLEGAK